MPSCPHRHPLWTLPYFSPSCQGTTGFLTNLDFSIDGWPLSSCLEWPSKACVQLGFPATVASGGCREVHRP